MFVALYRFQGFAYEVHIHSSDLQDDVTDVLDQLSFMPKSSAIILGIARTKKIDNGDEMYPLAEGLIYPRDQWYVAAVSDEVGRSIFERTILGEKIAFYRTEAGKPVAMQAHCPHRFYPFAHSTLVGDAVRCGYHGLEFDHDGKCRKIPSQANVPTSCKTRVYPTAERWKWVWIWMGDPALADESKIPAPCCIGKIGWETTQAKTLHVKSRYTLALDNLFDLSHLGFIHASLVGDVSELVQTPVEMTEHDGVPRLLRRVRDQHFSPYMEFLFGPLNCLIDAEVWSDYYGPSLVITGGPFYRAASECKHDHSPQKLGEICFIHAITPETPTTSFYFGGVTRDFRLGDEAFSAANIHMYDAVRQQDEDALEAVEQGLRAGADTGHEFSAMQDVGGIRIRRLLTAQIQAELSSTESRRRSA
jgi:nitrite reductase/ring-hydroxylating ferredoxin subunit